MSPHPDDQTLVRLVAGKLEPDRSEAVLSHISDCDACLERAEAAWGGIENLAGVTEAPPIGDRSALEIEIRLLRRVHLAQLGTQVSWLVTDGFLAVVLVLLRPVFGRSMPGTGGGKK